MLPGTEFRVFDVGGVKGGINICYESRHPGSSLALAHLGAEVILHPHGNYVGNLGKNPVDWTARKQAYLGARAVDTCTYSLICNSVGNVVDRAGNSQRFSGGAVVLGPTGESVARSTSKVRRSHMIIADLDIEHFRSRRVNSAIRQRRAGVYVKALGR